MKKFKKLSEKNLITLQNRIKRLLAAGLDYCANTKKDKNYWFSPLNPYYCEAFGILQGLECLDYGYFGADNVMESEHNLKFWFNCLKSQVKVMGEEIGEKETYKHYCNI